MHTVTVRWLKCSPKLMGYTEEMRVVFSDHPKYTTGNRVDLSRIRQMGLDGYKVEILPLNTK